MHSSCEALGQIELNLFALIEAIEHNWPRPTFSEDAFTVKILTTDVKHNKHQNPANFIDDIAGDDDSSESTQSDLNVRTLVQSRGCTSI